MEIRELIDKLEEKYPFSLQESWDNSGLQIGNPNDKLKNVLISLDLEEEGIKKAIENDCNLIITHHPYLFAGAKVIDFSKNFYKRLQMAIKNDITIYAFHTNLDIADGGLNDNFCDILDIKDTKVLERDKNPGLGRFGIINRQNATNYIEKIKTKLRAEGLVVYGDINKDIEKIAVCGGAGAELIEDAISNKCDLIVTGDVKYHDGMDLADEGIIIVDAGHFASENHVIFMLEDEVRGMIDGKVLTYSKEDSFRKFF